MDDARPRCERCGFSYAVTCESGFYTCGHCGNSGFAPAVRPDPVTEDATMNIPWDNVKLELRAEREIASTTARVHVRCVMSVTSAESDRVPSLLTTALEKVLPGSWTFTGISRQEDDSGREQIEASASVRVEESKCAGLVDRVKAASRPGLRLSLEHVSTRPPREEIDRTRLELRRAIYADASRELALLNESLAVPDQPWDIAAMTFGETMTLDEPIVPRRALEFGDMRPRSIAANAGSSPRSRDGDDEGGDKKFAIGTRMSLTASVVFRRLAVAPPEGGFFRAADHDA